MTFCPLGLIFGWGHGTEPLYRTVVSELESETKKIEYAGEKRGAFEVSGKFRGALAKIWEKEEGEEEKGEKKRGGNNADELNVMRGTLL
jgi:hypothetical protein